MGNCDTVNCCKKNEKGTFELMQEIPLDTSTHSRYDQLIKTKETMIEVLADPKNEKNIIYFENGCT